MVIRELNQLLISFHQFYYLVNKPEFTPNSMSEKKAILAESLPLKILLVEDTPVNQKVASLMLKKLGYTIEIANNGIEALACISSNTYDIILMDVQMPELDGIETTISIRKQGTNIRQPWIIAMTASALAEDRDTCLKAGMNDYISKPVRSEIIVEAFQRYQNEYLLQISVSSQNTTKREFKAINNLIKMIGDDDHNFIIELTESYLQDTPNKIKELQLAIIEQNSEKIDFLAHTIKSSTLLFGENNLTIFCQSLEQQARNNELINFDLILTTLQQEYEQFMISLKLELTNYIIEIKKSE